MFTKKLIDESVIKYLFDGKFGLEKESLRVDENGFLSHTPHPFEGHPNIDRDFCENQVEIITGICDSIDKVYDEISKLHEFTVKTLYNLESGKEYLWNFSNPPYVRGEKDIPVATFTGNLKGKELYRQYLAKKYGKKKMLFSGIHFNFSFSDKLIEALLHHAKDYKNTEEELRSFKDKLYLNLAQNVTKYSWLIVYLTAASPLIDGSYVEDEKIGEDILSHYASIRCSEVGYWNDFIPILDYDSVKGYADSIQSYVESGQLIAPSELYYPVRLKPKDASSSDDMKKNGVDHIELRMLDLNPLSPIGIFKEDIQFIHLLLIYLASKPIQSFEDYEQIMAVNNAKKAAFYKDRNLKIETGWSEDKYIKKAAIEVLDDMTGFYEEVGKPISSHIVPYINSLQYQREKLTKNHNRYAERIMQTYKNNYVKQGLEMAEQYAGGLQYV